MTATVRQMVLTDIPAVVDIDQQSFSLPWPETSYRYELERKPGVALPGGGKRRPHCRGDDRLMADR